MTIHCCSWVVGGSSCSNVYRTGQQIARASEIGVLGNTDPQRFENFETMEVICLKQRRADATLMTLSGRRLEGDLLWDVVGVVVDGLIPSLGEGVGCRP